MKWNWTVIFVPTRWNGKIGELLEVFGLFRNISSGSVLSIYISNMLNGQFWLDGKRPWSHFLNNTYGWKKLIPFKFGWSQNDIVSRITYNRRHTRLSYLYSLLFVVLSSLSFSCRFLSSFRLSFVIFWEDCLGYATVFSADGWFYWMSLNYENASALPPLFIKSY